MKIITAAKYRFRFIVAIISPIVFLTNCVSPFDPEIQGKSGLLVVDGSIIKGRETQTIMISKTSSISRPEFLPVENCNVRVMDNTGNEFLFKEESPGKYVANMDDALLNYDKQYKLIFTTSSGGCYESNYQILLETAPVDSLYCKIENHYSSLTGTESINGIQFYVDLDAPDSASRYYRWVLEETYERHAKDESVWGMYDGQVIKTFLRRDSLFRCWETKQVTGLYSATTFNLSKNRIKKAPLHFVESKSPKLMIKYCATIAQYALNADAYEYWYQKERELKESGNIYSIQPGQPKSNIHNLNDPAEQVMGFFWVASSTMKRVFTKTPAWIRPEESTSCNYVVVFTESQDFHVIADLLYSAMIDFKDILPDPPLYITVTYGTNYSIVINPSCADCRAFGGVIQKPDFWEEGK